MNSTFYQVLRRIYWKLPVSDSVKEAWLSRFRVFTRKLYRVGASVPASSSSESVRHQAYLAQVLSIPAKPDEKHVPIVTEAFERREGDPKVIAYYLPQFHPTPENDVGGARVLPNGTMSRVRCRNTWGTIRLGCRVNSATTICVSRKISLGKWSWPNYMVCLASRSTTTGSTGLDCSTSRSICSSIRRKSIFPFAFAGLTSRGRVDSMAHAARS